MKDVSRSPARRNNDGFHRYLKPGALAQIRNSKINNNARSTSHPQDLLSPSRNSASESAAARNLTVEQVPHLLSKIYGPCSYKRKKLAVARSVSSLMIVNLNTPLIESNGDVIAH
ncbi:unnamed protein product [Cochlearia groenlandica]